jgi:DNA-binding MarR family transcriptional regulator
MESKKQDIGTMLGRTTRLTGKVIAKRFQEAKINLTIEQFALLHMLAEEKCLIQQELADIIKKHKSAVLRLIDALEQRELVNRIPDATDRRKRTLVVTTKGKALLEKANAISNEVIKTLQDGLTAQEVDLFEKVAVHMQAKALKQISNSD